MATTTIIVEILIVGFFTGVWILLFCLRVSLFQFQSVTDLVSKMDSAVAVLVLAFTSYQLGVLMNTVSYRLTKRLAEQKYRNEIVPNTSYERVWATVRQNASEELAKSLYLYLSVVRLTRAGIINFPLIAAGMFSFGGKAALSGFIPLLLSLGCFVAWRGAYRLYYQRMGIAYQVIDKVYVDKQQTLNKQLS
jgi:hypothetical protein